MSTDGAVATETEGAAGSAPPSARPDLNAFLAELLTEQQRLNTPVARFAEKRASLVARDSPVHSELIPLTAPGPGEQYAFEVELDACSGCKACVASCHSLNGLDDNETWRDVGTVLGGTTTEPYQQTITTACHHCADPGCLNGCPVLAYEKDPVTGIVRHLDDQCIGCQYCVLKCPYDVPKYNKRLGIVRKCDMCHDRLAEGEAPACVQACPTHAITIVKVNVSSGGRKADTSSFPAWAPDPKYTQPTTRYLAHRPVPANARAADAKVLRPQPAHWPLVLMLVLTQTGIGLAAASGFVTYYVTNPEGWPWLLPALAWSAGAAGLAASVFHLGQPRRAWRVFLNLRRSWLSREAMALGMFFGALTAAIGAQAWATTALPGAVIADAIAPVLWLAALGIGTTGVFCSIMIYVDTPRQFWRLPQSAGRMFGTVLVAALWPLSPIAAGLVLGAKLILEAVTLSGSAASARLQRGPLRGAVIVRLLLGTLAMLGLMASAPWAASVLWLGGEVAERYVYFRAVDAPKMPGVGAA